MAWIASSGSGALPRLVCNTDPGRKGGDQEGGPFLAGAPAPLLPRRLAPVPVEKPPDGSQNHGTRMVRKKGADFIQCQKRGDGGNLAKSVGCGHAAGLPFGEFPEENFLSVEGILLDEGLRQGAVLLPERLDDLPMLPGDTLDPARHRQ